MPLRGGELLSAEEILDKVSEYNPGYVTVTGGEPLAQKACHGLLTLLADQGYEVSLETSGAISLSEVDARVVKVMDLKPPASGESHRNLYENIGFLTRQDQLKFVIADRGDYEWSVSKLIQYDLATRVSDVLFSPVSGTLSARVLAGWILEDRLPVRFQLQLHRMIWGDQPGV
ncbi:7-carboxy-7-deazaguanine synthase QueE [Endozoicomonas sp. GU-1]|uniref:7-carboxy-7-deazaguanine synthase QueE n=1 Tax=Endozoicomonas sp. GU-1 TaxID=3009078 RepID=UPI0022B32F23|nr:7-carboxy-7-deazaguanine synthase QueE [Endozoicomonas sp. GU-1]WBA80146.1 7-carboxy-7-deazaguanine synthase QueE [Endozoicomonas sp. GU-1]WBA87721.1 7-carboxy-7-deazaguanine synthase QueE [Endozoicomonas sp. GU-1]